MAQTVGSSYNVISYQRELRPQILQLAAELWSSDLGLNEAYFAWKHENNPYTRSPLFYLAMHEGRVVGMRGFFGVQWEAGQPRETLDGLYADDMVIAPSHRKRGLMRVIMEEALATLAARGHEYVFNLSAGPATYLSSLSMQWQSAGSTRPMRTRSWRSVVAAGARRLETPMGAILPVWGKLAELDKTVPAGYGDPDQVERRLRSFSSIVYSEHPQPRAMAELVERISSDGRIRHVRDRVYLDWRYQNPLRKYRFLYCGEEELDGYAALDEAPDGSAFNIVDWEGVNAATLDMVLRAVKALAGPRPVFTWSAALSKERLALLARHSFRLIEDVPGTERHRPALLVRAIAENVPSSEWVFAGRQLTDMSAWDLRMLYSMHG